MQFSETHLNHKTTWNMVNHELTNEKTSHIYLLLTDERILSIHCNQEVYFEVIKVTINSCKKVQNSKFVYIC